MACILCIVQLTIDSKTNNVELNKCYKQGLNHVNDTTFTTHYPEPNIEEYFMAFGSIMFAFGGASTFPTIQADMKDKSKFKFAAYIAMTGFNFLITDYTLCYFINCNILKTKEIRTYFLRGM